MAIGKSWNWTREPRQLHARPIGTFTLEPTAFWRLPISMAGSSPSTWQRIPTIIMSYQFQNTTGRWSMIRRQTKQPLSSVSTTRTLAPLQPPTSFAPTCAVKLLGLHGLRPTILEKATCFAAPQLVCTMSFLTLPILAPLVSSSNMQKQYHKIASLYWI